jgi:Mn2+/Fe2+ NRAMP family transporter
MGQTTSNLAYSGNGYGLRPPMEREQAASNWYSRVLAAIGPGFFILGYIIGTGSVTSLAKSGAEYGMTMAWALALSCFCSYVLIIAVSRVTIAAGHTLIYLIRRQFGSIVAILIIVGLMATVVSSVIGVMAILTDVVREWSSQVTQGRGISPVISAIIFNSILYFLIWRGAHGLFIRAMAVMVAIMGLSFIATAFLVLPGPVELIASLRPSIPESASAHLVLAALVGTTMASVCVVARTYVVAESGWGMNDLKVENCDAIIAMVLTFLVSASIMASAAGTMLPAGIRVERAIDMVKSLEPLAGPFATALFVTGIIAAALSSLFPNYVLGPWLVCDYLNVPRKMDHAYVRIAIGIVAMLAFTVPVFGGKPVIVMLASQAVSTVVMPVLILLLIVMLQSARVVRDYECPWSLTIALWITLGFAVFISYSGFVGLVAEIRSLNNHLG